MPGAGFVVVAVCWGVVGYSLDGWGSYDTGGGPRCLPEGMGGVCWCCGVGACGSVGLVGGEGFVVGGQCCGWGG